MLPIGDDLQSALGESDVLSLDEYIDYFNIAPDICLEKEMVWPVEPDLIYWFNSLQVPA